MRDKGREKARDSIFSLSIHKNKMSAASSICYAVSNNAQVIPLFYVLNGFMNGLLLGINSGLAFTFIFNAAATVMQWSIHFPERLTIKA